MELISTRDKNNKKSAPEAIIQGIAEDGGLFVPESPPSLPALESLRGKNYQDLAKEVLGLFFEELGETLENSVDSAYDSKFPEDVVPLETRGNVSFLELYQGPTSAFKDMALSILPYLLKTSLEWTGDKRNVLILVATSGDTGKAALEGFKDVKGTEIMVFYPEGGVSDVQKLQMSTQEGNNTYVYSIIGNFDDAQTSVKEIFANQELNNTLAKLNYTFSSANSINIGRLTPQVVYYVYGYMKMVEREEIKLGDRINVCVPTGNFGNVLAAYYAKNMGLPIDKLIVASNDNKVLTDFFNSGHYNSDRELLLTSSPSMDILVSSNLERLLYHLSGDTEKVKEAMDSLQNNRSYNWEDNIEDFWGGFAGEDEVSEAIKAMFEDEDYLIDPHTAVAYSVYKDYVDETGDRKKTLITSTASPYKFPAKVLESLGYEVPEDGTEALKVLSEKTKTQIPYNLQGLKEKETLHDKVLQVKEMSGEVLKLVESQDV